MTSSVVALAASGSIDVSLYVPFDTKNILPNSLSICSAPFDTHGEAVDVLETVDNTYQRLTQNTVVTTTQQKLVLVHRDIVGHHATGYDNW